MPRMLPLLLILEPGKQGHLVHESARSTGSNAYAYVYALATDGGEPETSVSQ